MIVNVNLAHRQNSMDCFLSYGLVLLEFPKSSSATFHVSLVTGRKSNRRNEKITSCFVVIITNDDCFDWALWWTTVRSNWKPLTYMWLHTLTENRLGYVKGGQITELYLKVGHIAANLVLFFQNGFGFWIRNQFCTRKKRDVQYTAWITAHLSRIVCKLVVNSSVFRSIKYGRGRLV